MSTIVDLLARIDARHVVRVPPGFPDDATLESLERRLTTFFSTRLPASADVQDYVADVLITLRNYRGESSLKVYAFSVARKRLAEGRRMHYRRPLEPLPSDDRLAIPQAGLSTMLDRERTAAIVRTAVDAMEAPYGEVVRLRLDGLEPREIAERLGVCHHTVRSRLWRGFERLRVRLVEALGGDPRISG